MTSTGQVYGEKWLKPDDAWKIHRNPEAPKPSKSELFLNSNFGKAIKGLKLEKEAEEVYARFGDKSNKNVEDTVAVILHTRNKTVGEKVITDTHPFYMIGDDKIENTALIHNGTIRNHHKLKKITSNCDSEAILHEWIKNTMNYCPENITSIAKTLKGSYTVALLSSFWDEETLIPILDLFKSSKELVCGYVEELETPVFATTKNILEKACKEAKLTLTGTYEVEDGNYIRINAVTGETIGAIGS